jgi:hypothetical protein
MKPPTPSRPPGPAPLKQISEDGKEFIITEPRPGLATAR